MEHARKRLTADIADSADIFYDREDGVEHARPFSQFFEGVTIMRFEIVAVEFDQSIPTESFRDRAWFVEWWTALLIGHFEEEEIGQLFDIIAVGETVILENIAVIPKLLDELLRIAHSAVSFRCIISEPGSPIVIDSINKRS